MENFNSKIYSTVLQFSIVGLTIALAWFAFIYYPKITDQYKSGNVPSQSFFKPVAANSQKFPIETEAYRVIYEEGSNTYYAFIEGETLDVYSFNRDNTKLALKTVLSLQDLCSIKIIYVSNQELDVPNNLKSNTDC